MLIVKSPRRVCVFRGDEEPFDAFHPRYIGARTGCDVVGFWFTSSRRAAEYFGDCIRVFLLALPSFLEASREEFIEAKQGPAWWARRARDEGLGGVILRDIEDGDTISDVYCVLDPAHILPSSKAGVVRHAGELDIEHAVLAQRQTRYSICPDCGQRKVIFVTRRRGEDGAYCVRNVCGFNFYTNSDSVIDHEAEERWKTVNPGREVGT